ncbi:uncharacterized protein RAG0_17201 [Rhynchosporium agropyri]|uniref:Mitochondrial import inner membrane translocase subunit TIM50 n=1 Tax=Rhynchosporium agropyri TaxID=914238 RepID=A0A1E1LUV0_9HELO|nr:uncharacterized protein RAG0_17201 [Rhynchosporium agropyri]
MNPKADSFQPTPPAAQKPNKSKSMNEIEAVTQSLKSVSLKKSQDPKKAAKPSQDTTPPRPHPPIYPQRNRKDTDPRRTVTAPRWTPGRKSNGSSSRRDMIIPPSTASGGVPEPTAAYLAASLEPFQHLSQAQHLLVVIDLNGTLLFRPNKRQPSKFVARPNTTKFLRYCIDTFNVVIWSSARPDNVKLMCDAILDRDLRNKVVDIWGRDKFGLSPVDYDARTQCYKRLTMLWDDPVVARSHPAYETGGRWDHRNTVLVDDSPEKGRSEPFNMISIPEFSGDERELGQILPQVHDYLNRLSVHSNVAAYGRAHPFKAATIAAAAPPVHYNTTASGGERAAIRVGYLVG